MTDHDPNGRDGKVQAVALDPAVLPEATGTQDRNLGIVLIKQAVEALWTPARMSNADLQEAVNAAVAALKGLAPNDALEGMLATQMVATHNAAMECLRRSQLDGQSFEGRDQNLKHAVKLLATYARQVEAPRQASWPRSAEDHCGARHRQRGRPGDRRQHRRGCEVPPD
jgi:urease accessory protein UreF